MRLSHALTASFLMTAAIVSTSGPADAQTSAPGAYYAPPAWSQSLPASTRFILLSNFNNEAVLDRETGLVWMRTPDQAATFWDAAFSTCSSHSIGSRVGWRLPTMTELRSSGSTGGLLVSTM